MAWRPAMFVDDSGYRDGMRRARSYEEWYQYAMLLSNRFGYYEWRRDTRDGLFDYDEIHHRTHGIRLLMAKCEADPCEETYAHLMIHLRSDLVRGPAGILKPAAFTYSIGTKRAIEDYVLEIQNALEMVATFKEWHPMKRYTYLSEGLQAHGNTALLLSGGNSLSMYHLGVSKVLYEMGFFPRVVCGTGAGAVIAAVLCSKPDHELRLFLRADAPFVDFAQFTARQKQGGVFSRASRRLKRWREQGTLMDVDVVYQFLHAQLGDMTFQEAYDKTGRVLNIVISNLRECKLVLPHTRYTIAQPLLGSGETKWVANHLTAPDVVVATAAAAAISQGLLGNLLWKGFSLKRKNPLTGGIELYTPSVYASKGTAEATAINRLSEQFGVTCVIRARVAFHPLSGWGWTAAIPKRHAPTFPMRLAAVMWREGQYRALQALRCIRAVPGLGRLGSSILSLELFEKDCEVDVEIAAQDGFLSHALAIPSKELLSELQEKGERAAWAQLTTIQMHLAVEQTVEDLLMPLKAEIERAEPTALLSPDFPFPKILNLARFSLSTTAHTVPFPSPHHKNMSEGGQSLGQSSYASYTSLPSHDSGECAADRDDSDEWLACHRRHSNIDYGFAGSMIVRQMTRRQLLSDRGAEDPALAATPPG
eukprot:TRINITY_DN22445_c0_g1_i1.p1 TRINITY_DN22445_c0_g1~~TRINITY_DN22445_c0_g1_i1.p1  ORF type:complete len:725 (+),score=237.06 TRINITY_DN22445_c0_g1_i1:233-2176(+)